MTGARTWLQQWSRFDQVQEEITFLNGKGKHLMYTHTIIFQPKQDPKTSKVYPWLDNRCQPDAEEHRENVRVLPGWELTDTKDNADSTVLHFKTHQPLTQEDMDALFALDENIFDIFLNTNDPEKVLR